MAEAFIYDHVRSPRGRGKKDGALHEVSTVKLAAQVLDAVRDRNQLDAGEGRRRHPRLRRPGRRGRRRHRPHGGVHGRLPDIGARHPDQPLLRLRARRGQPRPARRSRAASTTWSIAGGVESMSRVGIGAAGNAWAIDPIVALPGYFVPQGVSADLIATKYGFTRTDVDAYAVESQQRAAHAWDERLFREVGGAGPRRQRHDHPRPRRAHAAAHQHAEPRRAQRRPSRSSARWAASTRSASRRIRRSRRSTTSITPAIPPASSTAPPPCSSARRRPARRPG